MNMSISSTAVILIICSIINFQDILGQSFIKDLKVETVTTSNNFLQLKIKWTGSENLKDAKYDLYVTPEKDDYCLEDSCTRLDYKENEIALPDPDRHNECSISPGCMYDVAIKTHANNGYAINTTYQVPECVGKICSCRHSFNIPNITIRAETFSTQIRIKWNFFNASIHPIIPLEKIIISIVEVKEDIYLREEDIYSELLYNNKSKITKTKGIVDYKIKDFIHLESSHEIAAVLVDSRGCIGEKTFQIVSIPVTKNTFEWPFIAILVLILIIVLLIVGKVVFKKLSVFPSTPQRPPQTLTTVYYPIDTRNNIKCTNMFENELYINKDIMEARKQCGFDCPDLEIMYTRLTIGKEIGKGAFGRVYIGTISTNDGPKVVAVKQLKKQPTQEELEEFLSEIATMKKVGNHPNIVTIYGCCTKRLPLSMIMEYVGCGDLQNYLRRVRDKLEDKLRHSSQSSGAENKSQISRSTSSNSNNTVFFGKYLEIMRSSGSSSDTTSYITQPDTFRPSVTETQCTSLPYYTPSSIEYVLDHNELHNFAIQIARGMNHLEQKRITHRDLAARNILISEQKILKISDFGLSRTGIYVNTKNKRVPLRWLSIEAIRDNLYSSKSDVWAFGIVLWEIGTLGAHPYCTLDNLELLPFLLNGGRLERPENCSQKLYSLMLDCWKHNPQDRPSFEDIVNMLEPQKQTIYIDFNELAPTYVLPPITQQINTTILNS